jgi:hypothetical protein
MPARFTPDTPLQGRRHDVMSVFEDVCFDNQILADDTFNRVAAAID